jgi:hypothetical protein
MKIILKKFFLAFLFVIGFGMTSCLEDSDYNNGINGILPADNHFVEVHLTTSENSNIVAQSFDNSDDLVTFDLIPVNLTSGPATSDVTIEFKLLGQTNKLIDSLVVKDHLKLADASKVTVLNSGMKLVIPKGSQSGYIQIKLKPSDFLGDTWVLGVELTSVSDAKYKISNLSKGFVKFGIKNKWDGMYINNGTMQDFVAPNLVGGYPNNVYLITQDGSSVVHFDIDIWSGYYHAIKNGASWSGYGSFAPIFKFDANNNVIAVTNYYGQPAANGRAARLDPTGVNKYDPVTKVLTVKYWMVQAGADRTLFNETYTFVEKR